MFLYCVKYLKEYESYFVINDDDLRGKLNATIGKYFIETKSFSGKLFVLNASIWFISGLELPVGGFFLSIRRNVIHLGHGTPLKNIGLLEKNVSLLKKIYYSLIKTNLSYLVSSSDLFSSVWSDFICLSQDKVLIAGQARNDQLFIKSDLNLKDITSNENIINIIYVPTWRTTAKVKLFPFDDFNRDEFSDFLDKNKINIFIRTHPDYEDETNEKILSIKNIFSFSGQIYHEVMDYLNLFDMLITDYSSIYFDYLILNRPLIFLPYDYDSYNNEIGFAVPYHEYTPGYKPSTMKEFINVIYESFFGKNIYEEERSRINKLCNAYQKDNCRTFIALLFKMKILS